MTANTKKTKRAWAIITLAVFAIIVVVLASLSSSLIQPRTTRARTYDLQCLQDINVKRPLEDCLQK